MTRVMAAHQPNFLPYLGFFEKMKAVEELGSVPGIFVIRDDCQYVRRDFHHRNRIRTGTGENWMWLYVPVDHEMVPIRCLRIRHDKRVNGREVWNSYHLRMIRDNYRRTRFFDVFFSGLEDIYSDPGDDLAAFNVCIIKYLAECFQINTEIVCASELPRVVAGASASETLANITRAVGADIYLSGDGGRFYLDMSAFSNGLRVVFQDYRHPVYSQRYPGFKPYMSAIDALFNIGRLPRSGETVQQ